MMKGERAGWDHIRCSRSAGHSGPEAGVCDTGSSYFLAIGGIRQAADVHLGLVQLLDDFGQFKMHSVWTP